MTSITPTAGACGGRYVGTGREVQLNYKIGNESILITLTYGPDKAQLYARSARTGNTAVYEKRSGHDARRSGAAHPEVEAA